MSSTPTIEPSPNPTICDMLRKLWVAVEESRSHRDDATAGSSTPRPGLRPDGIGTQTQPPELSPSRPENCRLQLIADS